MKQLSLLEGTPNVHLINNLNYLNYVIDNSKEFALCENTKKTGTFLTKNELLINKIIDFIPIDETLFNKKIFEPSCGNGLLILGIIKKVYNKYKNKTLIYQLINDTLFFNDINSLMIKETMNNIKDLYKLLFNEEYCGKFNSSILDYIDKNNFKEQKFDYIIGNPPYVTLYGRRDKKDNETQRVNILSNYSQFPKSVKNGKINFVMLFIERAIEMLNSCGSLTYIIDLAFFETAYMYIRKYLLENTTINYLEYNIQGFDVASGQIIINITKQKTKGDNKVKVIDNISKQTSYIAQKLWYNTEDEYRFRLNINDMEVNEILHKIYIQAPSTLKELYPHKNLRTCCMLLNMENEFLSQDKHKDCYPYYQGSKSLPNKYAIPTFKKYFSYNIEKQNNINEKLKKKLEKQGIKNKKRIGFGEKVIYNNPKIYIRQSAKEIIATYDENDSCANNSLYIFSLRDNSLKNKIFLKFLCGYFNSQIVTFYAQQRNIIRYYKGKQPQIKVGDLYSIRIPRNDSLQNAISIIVENIYNKNIDLIKGTKKIDKLLYDYYKISPQEIEYIEKSIKDFVSN